MNKKILFILHLPPPTHGSSLVGSFIKDSVLINTTFNTKFINLNTSKSIDEIGKSGLRKWVLYLNILFKVLNQLINNKPEMVYIAMTAQGIAFYKDMIIAFLAKLFNCQLVIHFHNKGVSLRQNKSIDNFLYKRVFSKSKVILLSKHLYSDVEKYVKEDNVYYCPNGIPDSSSKKSKISTDNSLVKLLFLSNLIKSKGVFELLKALKILRNKKIKFKCNFVGGIGDISSEKFYKKVKNYELQDCVFYLGKKFNQDKFDIFHSSDIFILPSYSECFPLVLLEASQFGLPIVSTNEGAIPEIINDGVNGFLVPKRDVKSLADKLLILINDENLRVKLGNEAYNKYKKEYTLSKFENNMCSILKSII